MSGYNVNPPTVPDGVTINIYGREPELLKSVTSVVGVTIKGLPGALIACVENNARAVISNVRLETASFVKDNDGTVELSNVAVEGAEVSAVDSNDGTLVVAGANLSGKSAVLVNTNNGTAEVSEVTVVGEGAAIAGSNESSITITNSNVVGTDTSLIKDNDGAAVITDSQAETMIAEGDGEVDLIVTVNNFDEFKANLSTATTLRLGENITYEGTYDLTKNVTVDLNGKTFTTGNMSTTWLNIKGAKVTFKNGVIEGKVYVQKNGSTYSNATFEGVTFGGTITFASVTQGSLAVQGGNSVYAKKCTFKGKGSTTPNVVSLESTSSGTVCFEECTFNSTMNRFYANPIGGTAVFKLLNCTFNKAAVVETSASWDLNNMTITGSKSLGVNLYVGKAKDNLTDEEKAILDAYKKNNKGTVYCSGVKY